MKAFILKRWKKKKNDKTIFHLSKIKEDFWSLKKIPNNISFVSGKQNFSMNHVFLIYKKR